MQSYKNKRGFSLVELTIVLALTFVMFSVVIGIFNQRRLVADDDGSKQIAAEIQKIVNEAKQSLGPLSDAEKQQFGAGDILYGQAIGFNNEGCSSSGACLIVYKVAKTPAGAYFVYNTYQVKLPQGFYFNLITPTGGNNCASNFVSCYQVPAGSFQNLYAPPINGTSGDPVGVLILNGSGAAYAYRGGANSDVFPNPTNTLQRQGILRLAISNTIASSSLLDQNAWQTTANKYYLNLDLSSNSFGVQKL